jgi:type I restriction enzyme M protein
MTRADLDAFAQAYKPGQALSAREEGEQFKRWSYDELAARDGFNLDIWAEVKDESLTDADSLPPPEVIAEEIVEHLSSALAQFEAVASELRGEGNGAAEVSGEAEVVDELLPDEG